MQIMFLSGNLASDCEIVKGKEDLEFIRFMVAANELGADRDDKPAYYSCRMRKTGVAERLKKGRYVALVGALKVRENVKDDKTYVNHDIWVQSLDVPSLAGSE